MICKQRKFQQQDNNSNKLHERVDNDNYESYDNTTGSTCSSGSCCCCCTCGTSYSWFPSGELLRDCSTTDLSPRSAVSLFFPPSSSSSSSSSLSVAVSDISKKKTSSTNESLLTTILNHNNKKKEYAKLYNNSNNINNNNNNANDTDNDTNNNASDTHNTTNDNANDTHNTTNYNANTNAHDIDNSPSSTCCCWPECCQPQTCIHHNNPELSLYRSNSSRLSFLHHTATKLYSNLTPSINRDCNPSFYDSFVTGLSSFSNRIFSTFQKIYFYTSVFVLKYILSESRRQFFYMMEKKLLNLPIKYRESEVTSYLDVKRYLQSKGSWPFMWEVKGYNEYDDDMITCNGIRAYPMSSYSYLDFIRHKDVQQFAIDTAKSWATGSHGPRMLGGNTTVLRDLEKTIAKFFCRDDCMVVNGGFLACMSAVCAVCKHGDLILADGRLHASLRAGVKLSGAKAIYFKHNDYQHLGKLLYKFRRKFRHCWILIESVYSMDGDTADLPKCVELSDKYDCKIILDEAHGLGVLGKTGRGLEELYNMPGVCALIVGTFSKSVASVGGYITASQDWIDFMDFHAPGNVFSAPLPAYCAGAALRAFQLIEEESWRVAKAQRNALLLRQALESGLGKWPVNYPDHYKYVVEGDSNTTVIPIVFKDDIDRVMRIASSMLQKQWMIAAVAFPACPLRAPRFRITATAAYTEDIIVDFVTTLVQVTVEEAPAPMADILAHF
eukprot:GHVQ01016246.1.p1 GENE.GHVQ01016246.1~~GHVQ01016246.1.p1  ORF type:complete len:723 (+),score=95.76 GHVQ01016246.1:473-2641(+)